METVDEKFLGGALDFIDDSHEAEQPFFVWFTSTRMLFYNHITKEEQGPSGQGFYNDAMVAHDRQVGWLLDKLD
jgi:arylsulfatase